MGDKQSKSTKQGTKKKDKLFSLVSQLEAEIDLMEQGLDDQIDIWEEAASDQGYSTDEREKFIKKKIRKSEKVIDKKRNKLKKKQKKLQKYDVDSEEIESGGSGSYSESGSNSGQSIANSSRTQKTQSTHLTMDI